MEHLKKFLGLTLVVTIIWLIDVFNAQVGDSMHLFNLHLLMALVFFAFYFHTQISKKLFYNALWIVVIALFLAHILASPMNPNSLSLVEQKATQGLAWEKWSVEKMEDYQKQGEKVFIDFTAKWCITCKVNEKLVLETDGFKDIVRRT